MGKNNNEIGSFLQTLPKTCTQTNGGVMSFRVSGNPVDALLWVLPALAHFSHTDRWTVWLAPPFRPDSSCFENLGFNLSHTRVVHRDNEVSRSMSLIEYALRCPTNAIVLAWPAHCGERDLARLQRAAEEGKSFGLVFMPDGFHSQKSIHKNEQGKRPEYTKQLNFKLQDDLVSRSAPSC